MTIKEYPVLSAVYLYHEKKRNVNPEPLLVLDGLSGSGGTPSWQNSDVELATLKIP